MTPAVWGVCLGKKLINKMPSAERDTDTVHRPFQLLNLAMLLTVRLLDFYFSARKLK